MRGRTEVLTLLLGLTLLLAACAPGVVADVTDVNGNQVISLTLPESEPSQPLGLNLVGEDVIVIDAGGGECEPSVVPGVTQCFFEVVRVGVPVVLVATGVDECRFFTIFGIKSFACIPRAAGA